MGRVGTRAIGLGLAALAITGATLLARSPLGASSASRSIYVDYEHGNDAADGRTVATAWKHSPGDPEASGNAGRHRLGPGDNVLFAAGVRYRGTIVINGDGTPGRPITFSSVDSARPAILDGSDPVVQIRGCTSSADCGGASEWQRLSRITLPTSAGRGDPALFMASGELWLAQDPNPPDRFYHHDITAFQAVESARIATGAVPAPFPISRSSAQPLGARIAVWVRGNVVKYRPVSAFSDGIAHFDPTGLSLYEDRSTRIATVNHPAIIDQPGEYAILDRHLMVAWLPARGTVSVASGRSGIDLAGHAHVVIQNLVFENFADDGASTRSGVGIINARSTARDIAIRANRFQAFHNPLGQGPIIIKHVDGLEISGNQIRSVAQGSGMRISSPAANVRIERNQIRRLGRTGVMLMGVHGALVRLNRIDDARGVHGNGISAYRDNRRVRIVGNSVIRSPRPLTFHGDRNKSGVPNDLTISNNLLIGTEDSGAALASWGAQTTNVTIERNVLLGRKMGALLNGGDTNVLFDHNLATGLILNKERVGAWQIGRNNHYLALTWQQKKGQLDGGLDRSVRRDQAYALAEATSAPPSICSIITAGLPAGAETDDRRIGDRIIC